MDDIFYRGYVIAEGSTTFAPIIFYPEGHYELQGHGDSVEDCKKDIDALIDMVD